jgi:hypothetical protein
MLAADDQKTGRAVRLFGVQHVSCAVEEEKQRKIHKNKQDVRYGVQKGKTDRTVADKEEESRSFESCAA